MIVPDKYTNLKVSVLGISSLIIKIMGNRYIKIDKVLKDVTNEAGEDAKYNFINALSFLFMTGKLDYNVRRDSIRRGTGIVENK